MIVAPSIWRGMEAYETIEAVNHVRGFSNGPSFYYTARTTDGSLMGSIFVSSKKGKTGRLHCRITSLMVRPEYQNQKVELALIKAYLKASKKHEPPIYTTSVCVKSNHSETINLFRKLHFHCNHYTIMIPKSDNEIVMTRYKRSRYFL